MTEQRSTISTLAVRGRSSPRLDLSGPWLEAAGFPVGSRVEVEVVEPGRLVVTRADVGGPLLNLLPLVWVPVEQLAALEEAGR